MNKKIDRDKKKCADKIRKSHTKYENGKISLEKFYNIIVDCGIDSEYWTLREQQNLIKFLKDNKRFVVNQYDDNSNREIGFTHSPYHTIKGKFFQGTIKNTIRKTLHLAEWYIENKYDQDAFVYDDPRLKDLDEFLNLFIESRFQHAKYKLEFMHQIRNIACFMIKEDPYYTSVAWDFMNRFIERYPNGFKLTKSEQFNLDNYHVGTEEQIKDRIREYHESLKQKQL